jgi:hypothetical protein
MRLSSKIKEIRRVGTKQVLGAHGDEHLRWFDSKENVASRRAAADVAKETPRVAEILSALRTAKTASSGRPDIHFYVDPKLAENFNINLHLIEQNDKTRVALASDKDGGAEFSEETISFPSKRKNEPNYLCSVVFQKPEDEVYAVSAYLMETYLGRYAYKANFYFRGKSRQAAFRCYKRVLQAVQDLKIDVSEGNRNQNETPYLMKKALQGESGEVEPKSNKMATYLDPNNIKPQTTIGSENIVYIPKGRGIKEDLDL